MIETRPEAWARQVVLNGLQRVRDKGKVRIRNDVAMPRGDEAAGH